MRHALLPGDPPDESHIRPGEIHPDPLQNVGGRIGVVHLGVNAVVDHLHPSRVHGRIALQNVLPHRVADGDDSVSGFEGKAFGP